MTCRNYSRYGILLPVDESRVKVTRVHEEIFQSTSDKDLNHPHFYVYSRENISAEYSILHIHYEGEGERALCPAFIINNNKLLI